MMLKEALEFLADLKTKANGTEIHRSGLHRRKFIYADGTREDVEEDINPRNHNADDVESFLNSVNEYGGEEAVVWVQDHKVTAIIDDAKHRENVVVMSLYFSAEMKALESLPKTLSQAEFVRFLKQNFNLDSNLLKAVRKVDFHRSSTGKASLEHGKESLGRSVEAAVQGTEDIPESTTITVPVYSNIGLKVSFPVELRIDIDVHNEKFWIATGPNEIAMLKQFANREVLERLSDSLNTDKIYIGSP